MGHCFSIGHPACTLVEVNTNMHAVLFSHDHFAGGAARTTQLQSCYACTTAHHRSSLPVCMQKSNLHWLSQHSHHTDKLGGMCHDQAFLYKTGENSTPGGFTYIEHWLFWGSFWPLSGRPWEVICSTMTTVPTMGAEPTKPWAF